MSKCLFNCSKSCMSQGSNKLPIQNTERDVPSGNLLEKESCCFTMKISNFHSFFLEKKSKNSFKVLQNNFGPRKSNLHPLLFETKRRFFLLCSLLLAEEGKSNVPSGNLLEKESCCFRMKISNFQSFFLEKKSKKNSFT